MLASMTVTVAGVRSASSSNSPMIARSAFGNFRVIARPRAVADLFDLHHRHRAVAFGQSRNNRRAGRSHQFALDVFRIARDAFQQFGRGGAGHRVGSVRAFKCARPDVQRRRDDPINLQSVESDAGACDVNNRINRADFVEVNMFRSGCCGSLDSASPMR